ncbi:hypothetical protein J7F03_37115 [Streptomyces sp. ISL-43]|uniref:hypothetical protein n=1 Tax=Streptomyces sp. ISL-43 TaxID=2819183 RepID=UPI001BEAAC07|nr:hypothetical protein [Streptomyces sp. ISL-43]MBT2452573.1 hypothetical protein [Streptomyces sp. ISL-43]
MTAWQYFAGAGLVAALCPLHGHVEVAGDGHGRGARVDLCVPAGSEPRPPAQAPPAARPSPRVTLPGAARPTVRHPGRGPSPVPAPWPGAAPEPGPGPTPEAVAGVAQPPGDPVEGPDAVRAAPGAAPAPSPGAAVAGPAGRFHVRPYRSSALARRGPDGMSTLMLMVVVTTPAVLAAVALRPRSKSRS